MLLLLSLLVFCLSIFFPPFHKEESGNRTQNFHLQENWRIKHLVGRVETWEDKRDFNFSHLCLVGGGKWRDGKE